MRVRIGCTDGNTYESDDYPESVLQQEIEAKGGNIGTGDFDGRFTVTTVDEAVEVMEKILAGNLDGGETTTVTLIINDKPRVFQHSAIVWHEIVRDGAENG